VNTGIRSPEGIACSSKAKRTVERGQPHITVVPFRYGRCPGMTAGELLDKWSVPYSEREDEWLLLCGFGKR
jgi:hypothetical protein